ncbi:MAG: tRNA (N6-threonylcarbamoyladenosine(37)-N6)-methyltransferase TrmO [Akkermansiaceae bacterium]|nr:tRNA (N6-threonylcarbamoyladenosine(37)-N6)-methyltransferase TrmO [Akkermansiaceae bacterium]
MSEEFVMRPIGRVRSCYPEKFGVPRQSGLAKAARGKVVLEPEYRREEALRGLEGFSHVWVVFLFDKVPEGEERLSVRPPRLGGNERVGVWATRSPFRPNRIGLSVVKLESVGGEGEEAPWVEVSGLDLVDGTPVLDLKPYVPYADRVEDATGGFADGAPERLRVEVREEAREAFDGLEEMEREVILETLVLDGRPAYHEGTQGERVYFTRVLDWEISWEVRGSVCVVVGLK